MNKGGASNGPKPSFSWHTSFFFFFFSFAPVSGKKCCLILFFFFSPNDQRFFCHSMFSWVWSKQDHGRVEARLVQLSCGPFPHSDKVTGSNASLGAVLRIPVGLYRAASAPTYSPGWSKLMILNCLLVGLVVFLACLTPFVLLKADLTISIWKLGPAAADASHPASKKRPRVK